MNIHPTAIVHRDAQLGEGVKVGPYSVIGGRVTIGDGTVLDSHAVIDGNTRIGKDCRFFPFVSVGMVPQDLKYQGEDTLLEMGDRNVVREYATIHAGTSGGGGTTRLGNDNFLMAYCHVAHDCLLGNSVVMANGATLAGHVDVDDFATLSAFSGVHQYCRVGRHGYIGGYSVVTQDAVPFVLTVGNRARTYGINVIGLRRRNFPPATVEALQDAYRTLFKKKIPFRKAMEEVETKHKGIAEVEYLLGFIQSSRRGVIR